MRNRLNLGLSSSTILTTPSQIEGLDIWYKVSDTATLDNATIGGQVDNIDNRQDAGTQDGTNFGSADDAFLYYGANGRLCLSTLDGAENADFRSASNIAPPYTIVTASTLYSNPTAAQVYAGPVIGGTLKRNPANNTVFSSKQGGGDQPLETGSSLNKMVISVMKVASASDMKIIWDADEGTETSFDPLDASVQGNAHRLFGFYNSGNGAGEVGYHEGLVFGRVISDAETTQMIEYMRAEHNKISKTDWYLLAGQSNATGSRITSFNGATTGFQSSRTRMYTYSGDFESFVNPIADATGSQYAVFDTSGNGLSFCGAEAFADYVGNRKPHQVGIVPAAQGGTDLHTDWVRNESDHFDTSTLYGAMITRVKAVVDSGEEFKGVFWQQGEADAADSRTQAQYKADLITLINNFRSDTLLDIAWSIGVISDDLPSGTYPTRTAIQAAQIEFASEGVLTGVFVADTSDATNFPTGTDNTHYTTAGYKAAGIEHAKNFV